jgi:predicted NAD/FAD-dependent oxidoreductase
MTQRHPKPKRVAIVGAGLAGLMAAGELRARGHDVVLFDKGRSPGGRLATRRIGDARLDHGAQFFTARTEQFSARVREWHDAGVVFEWCRGFGPDGDGHPRYAVHGGMNALAKHLARDLDVRCDALVFSLHRAEAGSAHLWEVKLDDNTVHHADALIVTCPLPQTFSLLVSAEVSMPEELWRTEYDRTLALLAVLDRPSLVPAPGGVQTDPTFTFVADHHAKGISLLPAVTLSANPEWSEAHWDDDPLAAHDALVELARPYLGDAVILESQLKRWRFATPRRIWPHPSWSPDDLPSLAVAGDAFAGPRVEGAALSGLAAAAAVG